MLFGVILDRSYAAKKLIHEFHETHEITRNVLNSTFEAKPKLFATVRLEMVPRAGVEPARGYPQRILSP